MSAEEIIALVLCYVVAEVLVAIIIWPAIRDHGKHDNRTPEERSDDNAW